MSQHRYFKGPELDALLEEVRRELGAEATIVEANKVRSGGVAGFFATENFEVVATEPDPAEELAIEDNPFETHPLETQPLETRASERQPFKRDPVDRVIFPAARSGELVDISTAASTHRGSGPSNSGSSSSHSSSTIPSSAASAPMTTALLERADAVSVLERVDISVAESAPAPVPLFDEVLAAELAATAVDDEPEVDTLTTGVSSVEEPINADSAPAEPAPEAPPSLWPIVMEEPAARTIEHTLDCDRLVETEKAVEAEIGRAPQPDLGVEVPTPEVPATNPTTATAFWDRYDSYQTAALRGNDRPAVVTVIGQLGNAAGVADVIRRSWDLPIEPIVATTAHDVDVPDWNVERSPSGLEARVQYWMEAGRSGIVTIDASLQDEARAYIDAARNAGSEVLHLAVNSDAAPDDLLRFVEAQTGEVVVHFADRPGPDYLAGLSERGIALGSIGGQAVDPPMMLALAMAAGRG